MTATDLIRARLTQFVAALRADRLEWTIPELVYYFVEEKTPSDKDPNPVESFINSYAAKELWNKKTARLEKNGNYRPEWEEPMRKASVPELHVAPVAPARFALVARTVATLVGSTVTNVGGSYEFTAPTTEVNVPNVVERVVEKIVEVPVEKVVEKIVEVQADGTKTPAGKQDLEVHLEFPEKPAQGKVNPKFQTPAWYRRMEVALDAGKHVALAGPPGIGKSTAPEQYFVKRGQPFVVVNGDAGFRRRDVEGSVEIQAGTTFFKVAEFAAAAINGWGCILNEVNAADPDALLWINGILEVPNMVTVHGKAYPVHKDFRLVVTYNPGLIGTKALPQAFKDRFIPIKLGFPAQDFLRKLVAAKTGVDQYWQQMDYLLRFAQDAWDAHVKGTLRYQISPRRLFDAVFLLNQHVAQDMKEALRMAVVEAVDSAADTQVLERLIDGARASSPMTRFGGASR